MRDLPIPAFETDHGNVFAAEHHCAFWDGTGQAAAAVAQPGTAPRPVTWTPDRLSWITLGKAG